MTLTSLEHLEQALVPGQSPLARERSKGHGLVGSALGGEVEHGVLNRGLRRHRLLVDPLRESSATLDPYAVRRQDPPRVRDEDLDAVGGRLAQTVREGRTRV